MVQWSQNQLKVLKSNLLLLLLLEFVRWVAHVCQVKPQKNFSLFPFTSLRNRGAICPYLSTCLIRGEKKRTNPKNHNTYTQKNITPSDCCDGCPHADCLAVPQHISQDCSGGYWGGSCLQPALAQPAAPGAGRGGPCPPHCKLFWQPQECWQLPLHLSKGDKPKRLGPSTNIHTQLPSHNASNRAMTPARGKCCFPRHSFSPMHRLTRYCKYSTVSHVEQDLFSVFGWEQGCLFF